MGAVVADSQGALAGSGFYTFDGVKHAEVLALEQAGSRARGGTLYINLEPHCHQGRTPPCTDAIIAAGITRVVAAIKDPNPKVAGKGFEQLRAAGITVETGLFEAEARRLNEAFARYILTGRPLVTLKSGMTLDGKIAPTAGRIRQHAAGSRALDYQRGSTHPCSRLAARIRCNSSGCRAPSLPTIRCLRTALAFRAAVRCCVWCLIPACAALWNRAWSRLLKDDVLIFCSFAEEKKRRVLEEREASAWNRCRWALTMAVLIWQDYRRLGELEIISLLIEGGALVNWGALAADMVDKVFLYYAPKILAGGGSVPFAGGEGFPRISEAAQVRNIVLHRFSEDFAVEGYLHDPYMPLEVHS